jgi:hypothetical protein
MTKDNRIQTYNQLPFSGNAVMPMNFTSEVINGELLRLDVFSNFTGSVRVSKSGNDLALINATVTSGTNTWVSFPLSNTTGSFISNDVLKIGASGITSGTAVVCGPMTLYYR